jgi:hypothetical protein
VAFFIAELIDRFRNDPIALDLALTWRGQLDPGLIAQLAGEFAPPPLDLVPR